MKHFLNVLVVIAIVFGVNCSENSGSSSIQLDEGWWGPKHLQQYQDTSIRPFQVEFTDEMIYDLKQRLTNHRPFTPPLEESGFQYGFNTNFLDYWVQYWANSYDFKAREAFLNQFPQYKTNIQGLDIHFLWVKPDLSKKIPLNVEVLPMLYLHGWPGTVRELYESIPYLTAVNESRNFVLEVIVPSLPGFGFSDSAIRQGLGAPEIAVIMKNLMHRLGFNKFYIQGGDWGSRVGAFIATLYPEEVLGFHTNLATSRSPLSLALWFAGSFNPSQVVDPAVADRLYPIKNIVSWLVRETGYMHIQATKPDSIGVAMADSPSGLLAYILQLISSGTRRDNPLISHGGLEEHYSRDGLLDILSIIWFSNTFTTSSRIYAESINLKKFNSTLDVKPTPVPTWSVHAKDEIFYQSPIMLKFKYPNLIHSTILTEGGHFLAFEKPKVLADDVLRAITAFIAWNENKRRYRDEF